MKQSNKYCSRYSQFRGFNQEAQSESNLPRTFTKYYHTMISILLDIIWRIVTFVISLPPLIAFAYLTCTYLNYSGLPRYVKPSTTTFRLTAAFFTYLRALELIIYWLVKDEFAPESRLSWTVALILSEVVIVVLVLFYWLAAVIAIRVGLVFGAWFGAWYRPLESRMAASGYFTVGEEEVTEADGSLLEVMTAADDRDHKVDHETAD